MRQDVASGQLDSEALIQVAVVLHDELEAALAELEAAQKRVSELEKELGKSPTLRLADEYSQKSEEKRERERSGKRSRQSSSRRGGLSTADKLAQAKRREAVYPEGADPDQCTLHYSRVAWRLEDGRAVLVAYDIYRAPGGAIGRPEGVLQRCEYGIELVTTIAFASCVLEISTDKVCALLNALYGLSLRKSQADSMLHRLAREWEPEFDAMCGLLANSLVVHADETSWSINSVWAFLSEQVRVLLFGVHKDADTLKLMLDKDTFQGVLVSDDASVYRDFDAAQKCWAHLLRKAIKLTLLAPKCDRYRRFLDEAERTLRSPAMARKTGRTSKTMRGARRSTVIRSILESLRLYLKPLTLAAMSVEFSQWLKAGRGRFQKAAAAMNRPPPGESLLDRLFPDIVTA